MKKPILAILALILASLACEVHAAQSVPTVTPVSVVSDTATPEIASLPEAKTPTASPTAPGKDTATIQATVYVRQSADASSDAIGSLKTGDTVEIVKCAGQWCEIKRPSGYVWRGCTSNNPDGLLCQARP